MVGSDHGMKEPGALEERGRESTSGLEDDIRVLNSVVAGAGRTQRIEEAQGRFLDHKRYLLVPGGDLGFGQPEMLILQATVGN